jgi:hypothetical protein
MLLGGAVLPTKVDYLQVHIAPAAKQQKQMLLYASSSSQLRNCP